MTNQKPSTSRIQSSIIKHLEKYGTIQINLPDDFVIEIGITNEDEEDDIPFNFPAKKEVKKTKQPVEDVDDEIDALLNELDS